MKKSQKGNEPIVSVNPQYLLLLLLFWFKEGIMKERIDCKWMEYFENYEEKEKYLCHLNVDSKYVDVHKDCENCPFYENNEEN